MSDAKIDETSSVAKKNRHHHRTIKGSSLTLLCLLGITGCLFYDLRDMILADLNRNKALASITLGSRITQAERELNAAGYNTLYLEGPPESLFVSTLQHRPILAVIVSKLLSKTEMKGQVDNYVRGVTGFFISANPNGSVVTNEDGKPRFFRFAP